ncbi:MAG: DUF1905 domain-containing protein [Ilumatobacter sp.]|uniref:DUF1905 domain-containing protein n=1 Tax=Ilumatobacter sp. TaxID=1967498 RepID=UPI0026185F6F|nr:DUF1905 domain-containing protein [Ilumatobacter sp.]MDJ0770278.1 DUF1905 domain-containing protein [Ilumatobacter sp.]
MIEFTGEVEVFPQQGGWHYVAAPSWVVAELDEAPDRGLYAVEATVGASTWPTSLMPKGDGSHFLALSAAVRRTNSIELGDEVTVSIVPRIR